MLLKKAQEEDTIKGLDACCNEVRSNHLFFADDSIIFPNSSAQECQKIDEVIHLFEDSFGQSINFADFALMVSNKMGDERKTTLQDFFGVQSTFQHEKYLGLPTIIGRNKNIAFHGLLEKLCFKIQSWSNRTLSFGGKEVFLKSIAQAIPSYAISLFIFPKSF